MLSIFMQITLGFTPQRSGFIIAAGAVSSTIMAPLSGRLADHLRPRIITTAGVATVLASTLLALWLDSNATVPLVVLVLVVHGVGFGLFASPNMTVIMNSVPAGSISMASALGAKARSLGVVIGMIVITMLIARAIGDAPIRNHPREFAAIMHAAFQILSATTAIALSICLYTLPRKVERAP
jgi:MFS family permease